MRLVYRYYCKYRPPMPGAIPRQGLVEVHEYDYRQMVEGLQAWGYADYNRPLKYSEIHDYELAPSKENPDE